MLLEITTATQLDAILEAFEQYVQNNDADEWADDDEEQELRSRVAAVEEMTKDLTARKLRILGIEEGK